ncbi:MAG: hydroxymethylglutaryl-CoA reductase [Patescibacteria group bacterium]
MNLRLLSSAKSRREAVEKETQVSLANIGSFTLDESVASTRNCENMIGIAQVPMGVAGPLRIEKSEYYIPLATTEGALVASINRGCKAITESGGASVLSVRVGATRGPVFKVKNMGENSKLFDFLEAHKDDFDKIARTTSKHIALTGVETNSVGLYRFVRFIFDTQDAMGLNMVTIATNEIVQFIEHETSAVCTSLSGNYCVDKKPSWLNFTHNRGFEVWAEVVLPKNVIHDVLHTTSQNVYETWLSKCMYGSAMSGSMGFNAQYANVLAATFIATGQDPAHVAECSIGITTTEIQEENLYVSIYLPDLMVGTVGGGTGLATQKEALSIVGATNSKHFAEIIGGAVLAGEISLLSSLSEGSLVKAHQTLARGKTI